MTYTEVSTRDDGANCTENAEDEEEETGRSSICLCKAGRFVETTADLSLQFPGIGSERRRSTKQVRNWLDTRKHKTGGRVIETQKTGGLLGSHLLLLLLLPLVYEGGETQ